MVEKKQKELLIIIPAYNEEKNIERVLEELERPEIAEIAPCSLDINTRSAANIPM